MPMRHVRSSEFATPDKCAVQAQGVSVLGKAAQLERAKAATRDRPLLADRRAIEGQLRCCSAAQLGRLLPSTEISAPIGACRPTAVLHVAQIGARNLL